MGEVSPLTELIAAGNAMAKLIADKAAGELETDIAVLDAWSRALARVNEEGV